MTPVEIMHDLPFRPSEGAIAVVAALHVYFFILEVFLWKDQRTKVLAANQGVYNTFLAAGLVWGMTMDDPMQAEQTCLFFLGCVFIAGVFGGATALRKIFFIQALPAAVALGLLLSGH